MSRGVITVTALILIVSAWPAARGLASVGLAHVTAACPIRNGSASARGQLQLVKHDTGYSEEGEEEGEHGRRRRGRQNFCGPYFTSSSVSYFHDYYSRDDYANLPPGLRKHIQKTGHLPPGLEKKYERTGQLPPGLQKRFVCGQKLPVDYSSYLYAVPDVAYQQLGPVPPDSKLYLLGNDLILLNDHTKAIIDILRGAY